MPSIPRREFVAGLAATSATAGCLAAPPTDSSPTSSPASSPTASATSPPSASERIQIDVRNQDASETTVDLRLAGADETLLDRQVTVPADSRRAVDTGIDGTGEYELDAFVVGGPDLAAAFTLSVEEYDLRQGSNVILLVEGERIEMLMEE